VYIFILPKLGLGENISKGVKRVINIGVDQSLPYFDLRRARLLNVIVFSISIILLIFLAINLVQENYFLAVSDILLFVVVCIPSWILQYKKKYKANLFMITSAFFFYTTILTILEYDVNRQTEHILPAIAIMVIFLFDGWKKNLMFLIFPISFFTIRFTIMYQEFGEITFKSLHLIYLIEFTIVYVFASYFKADMMHFYKKLELSNQTKDKLFRIISHDLRSPFSSLLGTSELQKRFIESGDKEKIEKSSEIIYSASSKIYKLTQSLLEWSMTQTETFVVQKKLSNMNELIEQTVDFCEISATTKDIKIHFEPIDPIELNCDAVMTQIAVRNIIMNAVKFSHRESVIYVSAHKTDKEVFILIKDSGVGMDEETLTNVFEDSIIHSSYGTEKEKGSGLGLRISKELIEKQGGSIDAQSEPNEGSTFTVSLPIS
jgi:two-component system sensor histidine kinase/response regulator